MDDWWYNDILEKFVDYTSDPPLDLESQTNAINTIKDIDELSSLLNWYGYTIQQGIPINLYNNLSSDILLN